MIALNLIGAVAMLLWGLHMIHSGVMRAYGAELRKLLAGALNRRGNAFFGGALVTAILQSSTATTLIAASFTTTGLVSLGPALAVVLGANVGTSLIAQVLSLNMAGVAPLLLALGVVAFKRGERTRSRDLGRVAIGIGLLLFALRLLAETMRSAEQAEFFRSLLSLASHSALFSLLLAATLSLLAHSSLAVIILAMSLSSAQSLGGDPLFAAGTLLAMVAGANLGSSLSPLLSGDLTKRASYRVPIANIANRVLGCLLTLTLLKPLAAAFLALDPSPQRLVANFHLAFNLALALAFLPLLRRIAPLLTRAFPENRIAPCPSSPLYLDESAIEAPAVALSCAARETLRIGDLAELMLRQTMIALLQNDRRLVSAIARMEQSVDHLNEAVKTYVTKIGRQALDPAEARRAMEIILFNSNLEHIGDIVDKNLMELATRKIRRKLQFSAEGASELASFHADVLTNFKLAFGVFMSGNAAIARQLLKEKERLRMAELQAAESHFARLRAGRVESIETSALHLDILRDLRRVHSHLCSVAYSALETDATNQLRQLV